VDRHDAHGAITDRFRGIEKDRINCPAAGDLGNGIEVQASQGATPIDLGGYLIESIQSLGSVASGDYGTP
jgi:hypothetical protein